VLLLALVLLFVAACGASPETPPQAGESDVTPAEPESAAETGEPADGSTVVTATLAVVPSPTSAETQPMTPTRGVVLTETERISPTVQPAEEEAPADETERVLAELAGQVRHWQGDPDAPVTILDFSDFV
jgi:hypothetical protein